VFWQILSSFPLYQWAKGEELLNTIIIKFWGVSIVLKVFDDGPIKLASCQKKRKNLGCTPSN
jgi:hypothetical protein